MSFKFCSCLFETSNISIYFVIAPNKNILLQKHYVCYKQPMKLNISNLIEAIYLNTFVLAQNIEPQLKATWAH